MKIENHDDFPKLDHRTAPCFWAERDWVIDSPPIPRARPGTSAGSNKLAPRPRGHQAVTSRSIMPTEQLTYAQIAERLGVSPEAARAIVKRHRLPRSRSNHGPTLAAINPEEIRHKPLPPWSPRGHRSVTDVVAALKARVASLPKPKSARVVIGRTLSASASAPTDWSPPRTG
jgi:hypothetical protein